MVHRTRLQHHLVKILKCSNKEAIQFCQDGLVEVNGIKIFQANSIIESHHQILFKNEIIREGKELKYVLFHKPFLYEVTSNRDIKENIYEIIPSEFQHLFPLGRLDKNSEGLLLLTNDGRIHDEMMKAGTEIEKEYYVTTHFPITPALIEGFTKPFQLGPRMTLPAKFEKISLYEFNMTLNEGLNRQIRRICAKCGNQVKRLIRTRVGGMLLGDLKAGELRQVETFNSFNFR